MSSFPFLVWSPKTSPGYFDAIVANDYKLSYRLVTF